MTIVCFLVLARKCEFIGFVKIIKNEVFTYHEIRLQKTIYEHLNFNQDITNIRTGTSRQINALLRVSSLLSYQQKKVLSNSFISGQFDHCPLIWMFSSIRSYRKINKLHEWSLRLCDNDYMQSYENFLSKQDLVNIHLKKTQQLMIEIFKCLQGVSPSVI